MKIFKKVMVSMAVATASATALSANSYKVIDLGNLGSNPTVVYDVNNQNKATGYSGGGLVETTDADGNPITVRDFQAHAYRYSDESGEMEDLGVIEPDNDLADVSVGFSVNESDTVAGYSIKTVTRIDDDGNEVDARVEVASYFDVNGINQLPPLDPDDEQSMRALNINNAETYVVGYGEYNPPEDVDGEGNPLDNYYARGIIYNIADGTNSIVSPLSIQDNLETSLRDINDNGIAVGWGQEQTDNIINNRAIYINANNPSETVKLNPFDGRDTNSFARAINDQNQVVGKIVDAGFTHFVAFVHNIDTNESKELGALLESTPTSEATDINNNGVIVGFSRASTISSINHAFIYENDELIDLNNKIDCKLDPDSAQIEPADWLLTEARAINDNGVIVGNGIFEGEIKAFMLIPDDAEPKLCQPVVEEETGGSGSFPIYLLGLLASAGIFRRRVS